MRRRSSTSDDTSASAVSDLMAGLMVIFMLIAVLFMFQLESERRKSEIAVQQIAGLKEAFDSRETEIQRDLQNLGQKFDGVDGVRVETSTLQQSIYSPRILFATGESDLSSQFESFLSKYCPEFIDLVLERSEFVESVRIEGHTDDTWSSENDETERYLRNMNLSQARSATVLELCVRLSQSTSGFSEIRKIFSASGRSFSELRFDGELIDLPRSRRVDFTIRTFAQARLDAFVEQLNLEQQ